MVCMLIDTEILNQINVEKLILKRYRIMCTSVRNRRFYISGHVLFNSLNKLRKSNKMRGLASILLLFCNKFNKFNNTGAQILDSINHMILKLL